MSPPPGERGLMKHCDDEEAESVLVQEALVWQRREGEQTRSNTLKRMEVKRSGEVSLEVKVSFLGEQSVFVAQSGGGSGSFRPDQAQVLRRLPAESFSADIVQTAARSCSCVTYSSKNMTIDIWIEH